MTLPDDLDAAPLSVPGLEAALAAIWAHQHPIDCRRATYLIQLPYASPCGTGCHVHMDSDALMMAMTLGRVLIQTYVAGVSKCV
jgi:hypothetical protein